MAYRAPCYESTLGLLDTSKSHSTMRVSLILAASRRRSVHRASYFIKLWHERIPYGMRIARSKYSKLGTYPSLAYFSQN